MLRRLLTVLLLALAFSATAQEQVIVVANVEDPDFRLERHEVRNLFMGNPRADLTPFALPAGHPARVVFNTRVVGLTESRIQSYWAQMRFSGRGGPPREFPDTEQLIDFLLNRQGAVGYLLSDHPVPEGLVVIYRSD